MADNNEKAVVCGSGEKLDLNQLAERLKDLQPGDKIAAYFSSEKQAEEARKRIRQSILKR